MMMNRKLAAGSLLFCMMGMSLPVQAGLHKCRDARNSVVYQDKPCEALATAPLSSSLSRLGGKTDERAFLWSAVSVKGTAHLLGSLNFGNSSLYPLSSAITEPLKSSDVLVTEVSLESLDPRQIPEKLGNKGVYGDGSVLKSHVKLGTWNKLIELAKRLGVGEDLLNPLKPWRASLLLTQQALKTAGYDQDLGVDRSLARDAGGKKPIIELQGMEQQVAWLDELSADEQEQWLAQTMLDLSSHADDFSERIAAWQKGDPDAMDLITRRGFDAGPVGTKLYQTLIVGRAKILADKVDELLTDGRTYFIMVDPALLGGERGLLKLLEERGYRVAQR
jgi:uncharacterized protein